MVEHRERRQDQVDREPGEAGERGRADPVPQALRLRGDAQQHRDAERHREQRRVVLRETAEPERDGEDAELVRAAVHREAYARPQSERRERREHDDGMREVRVVRMQRGHRHGERRARADGLRIRRRAEAVRDVHGPHAARHALQPGEHVERGRVLEVRVRESAGVAPQAGDAPPDEQPDEAEQRHVEHQDARPPEEVRVQVTGAEAQCAQHDLRLVVEVEQPREAVPQPHDARGEREQQDGGESQVAALDHAEVRSRSEWPRGRSTRSRHPDRSAGCARRTRRRCRRSSFAAASA